MSIRLQRRVPVQVRRDAAMTLSNGRVLYDALFSRWGLQSYPASVEFRPREEVFHPRSLATLAHLPGVLIHPEVNYGTNFGPGSYPVRGCTGDNVVEHSDGIHTAGKLMVWDDEWNGLIERDEVAEISIGYTIKDDKTPGVAPADAPGAAEFGRRYAVVHRDIVGDHCAGVPEGNAGTARVIRDARGERATREALAQIAAARLDARPLYFDLGQWPKKDSHTMTNRKTSRKNSRRKDGRKRPRHDGLLLDVLERILTLAGDHPDLATELKSLASDLKEAIEPSEPEPEPAPDPEPAGPEPAADQDEDEQREDEDEDEREDQDEDDEPAARGDRRRRMRKRGDAAVRRLVADEVSRAVAAERARVMDAADQRADVLEVARHVFGRHWSSRKDGAPISTAAIMRAVVEHRDKKALERIDRKFSGARRDTAIEAEFERLREQIADEASRSFGDELLEQINAVRTDARERNEALDERLRGLSERLDKRDQAARAGRAVPTA